LIVEARPCLLQKIDNNEGGIEVLKKTDNINDIDIIRLGGRRYYSEKNEVVVL
jgi:hypothetical protein